MNDDKNRRVVVGVDGSHESANALAVAVEEAERRQCGLEAVMAWENPFIPYHELGSASLLEELAIAVRRELDRMLQPYVGGQFGVVGISVEGGAVSALLDAADEAELLVVGSRGRGGFRGLLLGSVSQQCVSHAHAPVMVVPLPDASSSDAVDSRVHVVERVVVGVDCSPHSAAALKWAVREATYRKCDVLAVLAYTHLNQTHPGGSTAFSPTYDEAEAKRALAEFVSNTLASADDLGSVTVVRAAVNDLPASALLDAIVPGDMLVVGARGLGGFKGLLLGSVSQQCLTHAPCPVVVIRGE